MSIAKYSNYSVEDFLEDAAFQDWAKNPSPDHALFGEEFLIQYPHQKKNLKEAQKLFSHMQAYFGGEEMPPVKEDDAFRKTLRQTLEQSKALKQSARIKTMRWVAVAASVMIALSALSWYLMQSPSMQVYTTAFQEWKTLDLPDGSQVTLNANSELTFAEHWDAEEDRAVWLKGEAYFQVEKKPTTGAKFRVYTPDLTVEVLGTSFNVHSRNEETDVFLEEGKIMLDLGEKEEFMEPGDFLSYSGKQQTILEQYSTSKENHISWKDGTYVMKEVPVSHILAKIEEIYGFSVVVKNDSLLTELKTVAIPMDEWEITFPILQRILGIEIIQKDRQLIIQ